MSLYTNHKLLVSLSFIGFLSLSTLVAIVPAYQMEAVQPTANEKPMTPAQERGLQVFISEGCVACHTQQVRNIEMDKVWGSRPSMASDYYYSKQRMDTWRQSPSLLGSERTGPDLTNVGQRRPGDAWNLMHLYDPRSVVAESIMPSFPWLFKSVKPEAVKSSDVVVPVDPKFVENPGNKIVATQKALDLAAYLESLQQPKVPEDKSPAFIPFSKSHGENAEAGDAGSASSTGDKKLDGEKLFVSTCAPCHQQNGKGVKGAFPPLAGSPVVNDEDPSKMIHIVLEGYNARKEYGVMPPFKDQLSDAEIAAIITHERSSWGNEASSVSPDQVSKIRAMLSQNPM